jgi:hypothetical protein
MPHPDRLIDGILATGGIRAFRVFSGYDDVVCFTECTPAGEIAMIRDRYTPWGARSRRTLCSNAAAVPRSMFEGRVGRRISPATSASLPLHQVPGPVPVDPGRIH